MMVSLIITILSGAIVLAGCSATNKPANSQVEEDKTNGTDTGLAPYEITIAFGTGSTQIQGLPEVENAINEITKKKINATVKIIPISYGSYAQQLNLMIASNEKLDLLVSGINGSYSTQVTQGSLLALDDLLAHYGNDIVKTLDPVFINAAKVNGKIYGITSNRDLAADRELLMRKDIVDKYQIDVDKVKTFADFESIFQIIKENEPSLTPLVLFNSVSTPVDYIATAYFDNLGDRLGVLDYESKDMKLVNMYESPKYAQLLTTVRNWYEKGYIQKDAATTKDSAIDLIKAGRAFSYIKQSKPGSDLQASRQTGVSMVSAKLPPAISTTNTITQFMWSIATNSNNPERAMMFLNLMFSDKEIINLLSWGIEGRDYIKSSENMIEYPQGVDAKNVPYGLNQGWLFGDQFKAYVFKGEPEDIYQQTDKFNKEAIKSPALGFTFNSAPVKSEVAAVTNVMNQFRTGLETGIIDPKELPQFISRLKGAGIDKVIAEKQRQLDEWVKTK